jgi:hypothetical protein
MAEWDREPLVPVTVTVTLPVLVKVQESVELPDPPAIVAVVRVHAVLSAESATLPVKPLVELIVIVEVPAELIATLTVVGLALIVKSWTLKETVVVCERLPLVPVTVTVTVPVDVKVHDRIEEPDPEIEAGVKVHAELSADKLTVPAKLSRAVTVIDEVPAWLTSTLTLEGLDAIVKSCTVKPTVAWWDRLPLMPVTVTV